MSSDRLGGYKFIYKGPQINVDISNILKLFEIQLLL